MDPSNPPNHPEDTGSVHSQALVSKRFERFADFLEEYASRLSLSGVFVDSETPWPVGATVDLEFRLMDGFLLFQAVGDVVWELRGTGQDGMGIRFHAIDAEGRNLILKVIEERRKTGEPPFDIDTLPPGAITESDAESAPGEVFAASPTAAQREEQISLDLESEAAPAVEAAPAAEPPPAEEEPAFEAAPLPDLPPLEEPPPAAGFSSEPAPITVQMPDPPAGEPAAEAPTVQTPGPLPFEAPAAPAATFADEPPAATFEPEAPALGDSPPVRPSLFDRAPGEPPGEGRGAPAAAPIAPAAASNAARAADSEVDDTSPGYVEWKPDPPPSARFRRWLPFAFALLLVAAGLFYFRGVIAGFLRGSGPATSERPAARPPAASSGGEARAASDAAAQQAPDEALPASTERGAAEGEAGSQAAPPDDTPADDAPAAEPAAPGPAAPDSAAPDAAAPNPDASDANVSGAGSGSGSESSPPSAGAPSAEPGTGRRAAADRIARPASGAGAAASPLPAGSAGLIEAITWRDGTQGLKILLEGEGPFAQDQARLLRIGGARPRDLLILRSIRAPFRRSRIPLGVAGVVRVRTGFHEKGAVDELHVVLDLESGSQPRPALSFEGSTLVLNYPPP